jgi:hypothetical protein
MFIKLSDTQLVILSAAAQREDRCLVTPKSLKGGAPQKIAAKLLAAGLVKEIKAKRKASASKHPTCTRWARTERHRSAVDRALQFVRGAQLETPFQHFGRGTTSSGCTACASRRSRRRCGR